jgi:hypothetical protein
MGCELAMRLSALFTAITVITQMSPPSVTAEERGASSPAQDIQQSLLFVPDPMAHQQA